MRLKELARMAASEETKSDIVPIPEKIFDEKKERYYERVKFYGRGGFGRCYEIKDSQTNEVFAAKIVSKKILVKDYQKIRMKEEISIHSRLCHKNVVAYHGTFEDDNFVYILLELCHQRSLAELHSRRKALTESETRYFMKQILEGAQYLHEIGIVHRDLKLANLLLSNDLEVKIADFGLAAEIERQGQRRITVCGTPNYVAPEILQKTGHSFEVDVWSMGCVMYTLLVGKPPFEMATVEETCKLIKRCHYAIPSYVRSEAAAVINRMLQPDPKKRPAAKEILTFEFFKGYVPSALPLTCLTVAPRDDTIMAHESLASLRQPLLEINYAHNVPKKSRAQNVEIANHSPELPDKQPARKALHEVNGVRENSKTSSPAKTAVSPSKACEKDQENLPVAKESRREISKKAALRTPSRKGTGMRTEGGVNSPLGGREGSKVSSLKKTVGDSCSNEKPNLPTTVTAKNCRKYLKGLQKQLDHVLLKVDAHIVTAVQDEQTDPAAQPVVWVSKWLDYSEQYGFAYQLSDGTFAVVFNDDTRLVLLADHRNIHYIESDGTENYHTMDDTPAHLQKKMKLLSYFRKYMGERLVGAGDSIVSSESCTCNKYDLSRSPYVYHWEHFEQEAVLMQLTNGTLQINFKDHTKIIMCPLMRAVSYIDPEKNFRTYKFSTIIRSGCNPCLLYALSYASQKIGKLLAENANEFRGP